jgi:hypothetical protein
MKKQGKEGSGLNGGESDERASAPDDLTPGGGDGRRSVESEREKRWKQRLSPRGHGLG